MRLLIASLLMMTASTYAAAAPKQAQCEALSKPIEAKTAELQKAEKATPQACAGWRQTIKMLEKYVADADKMGCPMAYVSGQPAGGPEERAVMLKEIKQAITDECKGK